MRIRKRALFFAATAAVTTLPMVVSWSVTPVDETACTAAQPPPGFVVEDLGEGSDEYVVPNDGRRYIVYGGTGNDVVVGGPLGDILCGGAGNDGLNGKGGDDIIVGGDGHDMLSGAAGNDVLYGGDGDDASYGGADNDVMAGELGANYSQGGPGVNLGDPDTPVTTQVSPCPDATATWSHWMMGVYRPDRFDRVNPCKPLNAWVMQNSNKDPSDGDGDLHFRVRVGNCVDGELYTVEFMPRDKPVFNGVVEFWRTTCNNPIQLKGASVFDCTFHPCDALRDGRELHPVYQVSYFGKVRTSGPQFGGSPWVLNPDGDRTHRFCWNEMGSPCNAWTNNDPFT